jgi:hypothetical protein
MTLRSLSSNAQAILNGTHRPAELIGKTKARKAGIALTSHVTLKRCVSNVCSVRRRNPGPIVVKLAEYAKADKLSAEVRRELKEREKLEKKACIQQKKLTNLNNAETLQLAVDVPTLQLHLKTYNGNVAAGKLEYLKKQYNARLILRSGIYKSIPQDSIYRSRHKPYNLKMTPPSKSTAAEAVLYLQSLLEAMMEEDGGRPTEPVASAENLGLIRKLPVLSMKYLDPLSTQLKAEVIGSIAADAAPVDDVWLLQFSEKYKGAILLDEGHYYRCFNVQYVGNEKSKRGLFACWEATCEPVVKTDGLWIVSDHHFVADSTTGNRQLKEQSIEGFTVADYRNGNNEDPVWEGNYADICIKRFEKKEAALLLSPPRKKSRGVH